MVVFPPAKINLGLHVLRKRRDGYHDLLTCFYQIPWTDVLEILPASSMRFEQTGITVPGATDDNLCLRAYHLLKHDFDLPPVQMFLHKILPMGAGLGGGSSDGAWTLRVLNTLFSLGLDDDALIRYAAQIGSDCPLFIKDMPMLGQGRGEILSPIQLNLQGHFLVVVKPDVHVSTKDAFGGIVPTEVEYDLQSVLERTPVAQWRNIVHNDFETTVFQKYPQIASIKEQLYREGALYASMSGSGSAVFGIFEKPVELRRHFVGMTYWSGLLS